MSKERRNPCLFDQANFLSKLTFWWLNPVFGRNPQSVADKSCQYDVAASDEADLLERRLDSWWKKEVRQYCEGGDANLKKAILSTFVLQWILPGLVLLLAEVFRLCQPVLLGFVVGYISGDPTLTPKDAYLYGIGLGVMVFLHAITSTIYFFLTRRTALKMKTSLEALLYRKVISLSCEAALMTSPSVVKEQFTANGDVFTGVVEHVHYLWIGPVQVAVISYLLHREVGTAGLLCLVVVVAVVLLNTILEVAASKLREKSRVWAEQRWQLTSHILAVMVQIKVCCLESTLTPLITSLRNKELRGIKGLAAVHAILWCMLGGVCRLMLLLVVLVAMDTQGMVTLRSVFTCLALLDVLMWSLHRFPVSGVRDWLVMGSTLDNIQNFLLLDEEKEQIKDLRLHRTVSYRNEPYADWVVDIDHMTARWPTVHTGERKRFQKRRTRDSTSSTKSLLHESDVEHAFSLKYLSLQVKKGELLAVVGPQLSGKTSLLMTLIGELPYEIGQISVNGRVAFCAQEPWLFSGSVRDNIVFGDTYDATRYEMVIGACSLTQLLEILPEGDETQVGERGLDLSRGYKAKITLARAVYHNADIYLLDDIFSCVDSQTRQDIMKWCISGTLESKTRVIVTRNLQYLKAANRIAVLREGSLFDIGSYEELQSKGVDIREFVTSDQSQSQHKGQLEAEEENFRVRLALWKAQKEDVKSDDLTSISDLRLLFTFLSGKLFYCLLPLLVLLWFGAQSLGLASDWTLATWVSSQPATGASAEQTSIIYQASPVPLVSPSVLVTGRPQENVDDVAKPLLYPLFVAIATVLGLAFALALVEMCVSAAKRCHDSMLEALMRAKVGFFLTASAESVMSVFSHHLSFIDTCVPCLSYLTAETLLRVFGLMVVMCAINPWLVMAALPLLITMATLQVFGARTLKGVRTLREKAREPVKSSITETLQGLETIRAFKRRDHFTEGFDAHLNLLSWSRFLALCVHSRLLLICVFVIVLFISAVIYVSIMLVGSINSGLLALCVTYCVTLLTPVQALMQYAVSLGDHMMSVQQALALRREEQEPALFSDKPPPDDWPNRGSITFSSTSLLAGPNGTYLLRDINVHIKSREKVGVVGDAGSGKYSLVAALLRLGQVQGMLFMDGFDILKIGLHELRKNISVVPKDPILLPGTLRSNLDLSGLLSDEELWGILEQVGLRDRVAGIRGGLSVDVGVDASLLSLGQKQLLYLARAVIRKTKLILFEEATDNIEPSVNDQIQRILRAKFRDCTVLTVAHRLPSVMDCDRIMVFHKGEAKEFDTPYNLMNTGDGYFMRLVEQGSRRQAQHLRSLAELSHQQRASASLMLEHAVFMATEQLHASTEDLTFRPGSLAWSNLAKFTKSQDSLEKAYSDWGSRGDVRDEEVTSPLARPKPQVSMAPAQKLINKRRMSPNRGKRAGHADREEVTEKEEGGEQLPLLSYDTPPKLLAQNSAESDEAGREKERTYRPNNGKNVPRSVESSPIVDYSSSPRPRVRSPTNQNAPNRDTDRSSSNPRGVVERRILETSIDTPPVPRRNFSPSPSIGEASAPPARVQGRSEKSRGRTSGRVGYPSSRPRIISGEYSPPGQESKEDTERIIFC
ncbi:ATP-binding cassette subfamily C member 4-like [Littorina saxatilis]|uniref:ATP-binding cassette subfamily C member 4-like n=1 Tax=Littorina saxatilis TaxID=31220 RepID=UPI0038B51917